MLGFLLGSALAAVPAAPSPLAPFRLSPEPASTYVLVDTPLPEPSGGDDDRYARQYLRHVQLADAGLITLGVGVGVTTVSLVVVVGAAVAQDESTALVGLGGVVLGTLASYVGQALFSIGGLQAAYDLRQLGRNGPVVLGWVTCGMMAGGLALSTASSAADLANGGPGAEPSAVSIAASALTVGSLVPGFITYFDVRKEGVDLRASVVPTAVPLRLADGSLSTVPGVALTATW